MSPEKDVVRLKTPKVIVAETCQDSDARSGYGDLCEDESSICDTLHNIDPAWDTDAGSCFGSDSPSLYSESSFGSFSGEGYFSDSCSSNMTSDLGPMVTRFYITETE